MPRRGEPFPKLGPEVGKAIADAVRVGVPLAVAAELSEVSVEAVYEWIRRGEGRHARPKTRLTAHFAQSIKKARAQDVARRVGRVEQAAKGGSVLSRKTTTKTTGTGDTLTTTTVVEESYAAPQWTADMTHLERRYPQYFGRQPGQFTAEEVAALGAQFAAVAAEFIAEGRRAEFAAALQTLLRGRKASRREDEP